MNSPEKMAEKPLQTASHEELIVDMLKGVHGIAALEAISLAAKAGLNTHEVYDIIVGAAGNSCIFEQWIPAILGDETNVTLNIRDMIQAMDRVTALAQVHNFPLPLAGIARQTYVNAASQATHDQDLMPILRGHFQANTHTSITQLRENSVVTLPELTPTTTPIDVKHVGFIGLGQMGYGQANILCNAGFQVSGHDISKHAVGRFIQANGKLARGANTPSEAAQDAQVLFVMVQNAQQVEEVLFGTNGALETLTSGAVVVITSTVPPEFMRLLQQRILQVRSDIDLVDAPVSGGTTRAANGTLTIMSSGSERALSKANQPLLAMSGSPSNLHTIKGGVGAGSSVKIVNQLLAGVHIVAAAEAMALGAKLGLDTGRLFNIITASMGSSWMVENRVPAMLLADWTPHSALSIFLKDMGIVLGEARRLQLPAYLAEAAFQMYQFGACMAKDADSGVVRVWETMSGISVAEANRSYKKSL